MLVDTSQWFAITTPKIVTYQATMADYTMSEAFISQAKISKLELQGLDHKDSILQPFSWMRKEIASVLGGKNSDLANDQAFLLWMILLPLGLTRLHVGKNLWFWAIRRILSEFKVSTLKMCFLRIAQKVYSVSKISHLSLAYELRDFSTFYTQPLLFLVLLNFALGNIARLPTLTSQSTFTQIRDLLFELEFLSLSLTVPFLRFAAWDLLSTFISSANLLLFRPSAQLF